jgi:hypothetical protein
MNSAALSSFHSFQAYTHTRMFRARFFKHRWRVFRPFIKKEAVLRTKNLHKLKKWKTTQQN